jgi:serine/threonine protein kinase
VLEYCPNRDLLSYVKAMREDLAAAESIDEKLDFTKDHLFFSWQISDGMRFLALKGIVHRDLAARCGKD